MTVQSQSNLNPEFTNSGLTIGEAMLKAFCEFALCIGGGGE